MTDKELFLKYNHKITSSYTKNAELAKLLYNNLLSEFPGSFRTKERNKWTILLTATYACNLNCIYCENAMLRNKYHNAVMTEDIVRQIVRKLGPHTHNITWHGGESTLLPDSLLIALYDECKQRGFNIKVDLQSNGILLTPEREEFYKKIDVDWGTSFDGKWNDESRGPKSTKAILELLKRHNGERSFIAVVTKLNIDKLIENYEYYKSISPNICVQTNLCRESQGVGQNDFIVPNNIAIPKVLEYFNYWMHDTTNPILDTTLQHYVSRVLGNGQSCEECNCIGGWLIIDPLGNITCCGGDPLNSEDRYCNINDIKDYKDLLSSPKYLKSLHKQQQLVEKSCKDCVWLSTCYGGCLGTAYELDKTYSKVNPRYCEYEKGVLDGVYNLINNIPEEDLTESKYNKYFIQALKDNCYYNLDECKLIEERRGVL